MRSIQRRTGSAAVADDVTAAAFERAWRSLGDVAERGMGFRPWVFRIAMNELIDVRRSTGRRTQREEEHGHGAVASSTLDRPESTTDAGVAGIPVEDVRSAIGTLSSSHQEVISLRWFADLEPSEIAATLGISKGAVAVRTHRAMAALRAALGVDTTEGPPR